MVKKKSIVCFQSYDMVVAKLKHNIRNTRPVVKVPLRDKLEYTIVSKYTRYITGLNYQTTIKPFKQTIRTILSLNSSLVFTNFGVIKDVFPPTIN